MMKILFHINFHTVWGQKLCITGSIPQLGTWKAGQNADMNYVGDGNWQLDIDAPLTPATIEYRYLVKVDDLTVFEEWDKNHRLTIDERYSRYILYDNWQSPPPNLALYSSAFTQNLFAHPAPPPQSPPHRQPLTLKVFAPHIERRHLLALTGNQPCLGNWQPEKAPTLLSHAFPEWEISFDAANIHYPLEYKFLVIDADTRQPVYWEPGDNRLLTLPPQTDGEAAHVTGLCLRDNRPPWRGAGSVVPVFSLRSERSFGIGDLADLRLLVDWIHQTGQHLIQILPVNDTTATHTWTDSYPYNAISIYAIHPIYISLAWLGHLADDRQTARFEAIRNELNHLPEIDYEAVLTNKMEYCRLFFLQKGRAVLDTEEFGGFFARNQEWLLPYAAYSYFRDVHQTADFSQWGPDAVCDRARIARLCSRDSQAWPEVSFTFFLQYVLHQQFANVSAYARKKGVVLKGDLPIGVNRHSVDVWQEPRYFNMNGQAGAPPDDFSPTGQNWTFPTYNWEEMEKNHFAWWKKRFTGLSDYFDCFRIDHILGFFRIWEIPLKFTEGLCGHFNPALPLSAEEIEQYGIEFNESRFTTPHIHRQHLEALFGPYTGEATDAYLAQSSSQHFVLKPFCDTQIKIEALFAGETDAPSLQKKKGLLSVANEALFLRDPYRKDRFHPRVSASQSYLYLELDNSDRYAFDHLYWDFFYRRHNDFWKEQAYKRLTPLIASTRMLVCGEDLGMIPESVPEVMGKLQILSLEIERVSKTPHHEFADLGHLPYLSVCTTSTHDMNPLRSWWREDREKTQRYYNNILRLSGEAPWECTSDIAGRIIGNHLQAPSMLTIIPLQDWMAVDDGVKRKDYDAERINVPANASHYWRYRMHITIEELLRADDLNEKITALIKRSGRLTL
ncbi:MAG: 4-alpha-glucanotransferase [Tannerellaceae bacterium]|jgi:4-alpha-glucanotransferase|nr:4-alpha-glucanotransferase [Tannerellaceae bacterium]